VVGLVLLFVLPLIILPMLASTGRVTGNRQAIILWRHEMVNWKNSITNSPRFDFYKLPGDDQSRTIHLGCYLDSWLKTNFVWGTISNREIVIVCGREFDNVPKPSFWNSFFRNPAHAIGYSNGSVGLISPNDFTNLNLNGYVSAWNLATNSEFGISKP
jgi:hypothetical protein